MQQNEKEQRENDQLISDHLFKSKFGLLLAEFIENFELVFNDDWEHSKMSLEDMTGFISENGTFINPKVNDEGANWGNRGELLSSYRYLTAFLNGYNLDLNKFLQSKRNEL